MFLLETNLVLFLTASVAVIVAPGPDNILVLTRGVSQGRGAAMVSAAGASLGLVVHSVFAAAGLSALLSQSALAFSVVKYVGAAYLIYLGVRSLLDRGRFALPPGQTPIGLRKVFVQAVVSNVLNPKIAVFFLAYLPQFADPVSGDTAPPIARFRPDLRAANPGHLRHPGALLGDRRLVAEDPTEARGRTGLAHRMRPDIPRPPTSPPGPPVDARHLKPYT